MDRREFFKLGFLQIKDQARKSAPDIIRKEITPTLMDVSILTEHVERAQRLAGELLPEHFGERFIRLKESRLTGQFPGGIVLFEEQRRRDYHDGASLFYAALREMEAELHLNETQNDPMLLRFVNRIPSFSRTADVYFRNRQIAAIPLHEEGSHDVAGALGVMHIVVANKRLHVAEAPCPHGTCRAHPPIITPGQRITCVPGDISIVIGLQK
ncbi:MAG: NusG domain II-containing protein [Bacteroidetes bacterium]|nr:NusG domain II-containing protein [Bacteroidota bacterium]